MAFDRQGLHFREIDELDLPMLREWRNNPLMCAGWHDPRSVQTRTLQKNWYESLGPDNQAFMVEEGMIGHIGLVRFRLEPVYNRSAITGIDVNPEFQGKGYSKKMLRAVAEYVLNDLGYHRTTGEAMATNVPANRMIVSCGFKLEGTFRQYVWRAGDWQDWNVYSLLRGELWQDEEKGLQGL